jgi:hypothetical protein
LRRIKPDFEIFFEKNKPDLKYFLRLEKKKNPGKDFPGRRNGTRRFS